MMWYGGWGWGGWLLMSLGMVLFWGVVIAGIVLLVRYAAGRSGHVPQHWTGPQHGPTPGGGASPSGVRPEDVLAERFARGEIDEEEYRRRLAVLREGR